MFLVLALIAAGFSAAAIGYVNSCKAGAGPHDPVKVTIPEGASGGDVVNILHGAGVAKCGGLVGKFLLRRDSRAGSIRAGTYGLTTNMTWGQALDVITAAPHVAATKSLPIPEGFRLTQIAARVQATFKIPAKQFMKVADSGKYSLPPYLPEGRKSPEGFLFPAIYDVVLKGVSADSIIREMLKRFETEAKILPWDRAHGLGVSPYEAVIVASMIEKEAAIDRDRPLISAVIYNRLKAGMQLGIDATLLYADPTPGDGTLSNSDLQSDSPYNTRKHAGLPPTPIASPGDKSLEAALHPANVDYLYYVLCPKDGKGRHRFSKSYDEFLHNKSVCLGS
ncbi:MAG: endolytic transglycosylase MltG [Actinomycetota bacterium]